MKYYIEYQTRLASGETVRKWIPSGDYSQMAQGLLDTMRKEQYQVDWLAVPFVLTLAAWLEAELNDWLRIDTLNRHGLEHYKGIVDIYIRAPFARKLRLAIVTLTENHFHLSETSPSTKALDEMISTRNKITHANVDFQIIKAEDEKDKSPRKDVHPVHDLTLSDCERYMEAVKDLKEKFFAQYDKGEIWENDLIVAWREKGRRTSKVQDSA